MQDHIDDLIETTQHMKSCAEGVAENFRSSPDDALNDAEEIRDTVSRMQDALEAILEALA